MINSRGSFFCMLLCFFLLNFAGCATLASSFNPQATSDQLAVQAHFVKESIPTQIFKLAAYSRMENSGKALTVYIEGDGRAWLSRTHLAPDPTPFHPMMLEMATMDRSDNVVYLGRPCQYDSSAFRKPCEPAYWSNKRFSEEVIASMNEAVDVFSKRVNTHEVNLVGYSGGGAVAVLLAARRQDIVSLRTLAGNLDPGAVNAFHEASPLTGSLDPMTSAQKISNVPQRHFIGSKDAVIPSFVVQNFTRASGNDRCIQVTPVPGATHHSGWTENWKELLKLPVSCHQT